MTKTEAPPALYKVDPRDLLDSPTNPRGEFSKAWDLSDLTDQGPEFLERVFLLARPVYVDEVERLELVYGHRRKHAAIALGVELVNVEVRDLTDAEVLKVQWAENGAREDVHPMREALHLEAMIAAGATQEDLAAESGKTQPWVSKRLSLCALGSRCRERFLKGDFPIGHALLLARIPNVKIQEKALAALMGASRFGEGLISIARARSLLQREFMLDLKTAQWSLTDAKLLPRAGACSSCPKTTKTQSVLFDDVDKGAFCADPVCWRRKADAYFSHAKIRAKNEGQKVLTKKESAKLFDRHGLGRLTWEAQKSYETLDRTEWVGNKQVKLSQAIKELEGKPATILAQAPDGRTVELVTAATAKKAFAACRGSKTSAGGGKGSKPESEWDRKQKEEKRRRRVENRAIELATSAVVEHVEGLEQLDEDLLKLIVDMLIPVVWSDVAKSVCARRGIKANTVHGAQLALKGEAEKLLPSQLRGLLVELVIGGRGNNQAEIACKAFGIKLSDFRAQAKRELAPKKPAKKAGRKKA